MPTRSSRRSKPGLPSNPLVGAVTLALLLHRTVLRQVVKHPVEVVLLGVPEPVARLRHSDAGVLAHDLEDLVRGGAAGTTATAARPAAIAGAGSGAGAA